MTPVGTMTASVLCCVHPDLRNELTVRGVVKRPREDRSCRREHCFQHKEATVTQVLYKLYANQGMLTQLSPTASCDAPVSADAYCGSTGGLIISAASVDALDGATVVL